MKALVGLADEARQGQRDLLTVLTGLGDLLIGTALAPYTTNPYMYLREVEAEWEEVRARV